MWISGRHRNTFAWLSHNLCRFCLVPDLFSCSEEMGKTSRNTSFLRTVSAPDCQILLRVPRLAKARCRSLCLMGFNPTQCRTILPLCIGFGILILCALWAHHSSPKSFKTSRNWCNPPTSHRDMPYWSASHWCQCFVSQACQRRTSILISVFSALASSKGKEHKESKAQWMICFERSRTRQSEQPSQKIIDQRTTYIEHPGCTKWIKFAWKRSIR